MLGLDPQLKRTMAQTLNRQAAQTNVVDNVRGDRAYAANPIVPFTARLELDDAVVENPPGNFRSTSYKFTTETEINMKDRIWLPSENTTTVQPRIPAQVLEVPDEKGAVSHFEVRL